MEVPEQRSESVLKLSLTTLFGALIFVTESSDPSFSSSTILLASSKLRSDLSKLLFLLMGEISHLSVGAAEREGNT